MHRFEQIFVKSINRLDRKLNRRIESIRKISQWENRIDVKDRLDQQSIFIKRYQEMK